MMLRLLKNRRGSNMYNLYLAVFLRATGIQNGLLFDVMLSCTAWLHIL